MTDSADQRLDRAIYGLFEQHIPIRKIKKMLHVGQDRFYAVIAHYEKVARICQRGLRTQFHQKESRSLKP
jgi:hypothetical protein